MTCTWTKLDESLFRAYKQAGGKKSAAGCISDKAINCFPIYTAVTMMTVQSAGL